jgi:hypothetical protein
VRTGWQGEATVGQSWAALRNLSMDGVRPAFAVRCTSEGLIETELDKMRDFEAKCADADVSTASVAL